MELNAYTYVGPEEIRRAVMAHPAGVSIRAREDLDRWLHAHPDAMEEGATWVVDLTGCLRLAPRRSEHVACAGGEEVLAAGEFHFQRTATGWDIAGASNQSMGYCPDTDCWDALSLALTRAGIRGPPGFTHAITFRRCTRCGEFNLVKEQWFVCAFCDADLPALWNVAPRRLVLVG
ncbi:hypothetical protein D7X55_09425 [Corallococcus sp. AB049A]|uniref:Uncharacterized protein n=1 Tax=Corallococcus interemptor TaxID=2316720 RepID=A0A3A8QH94_9BACT|nr:MULTISPECIES: hypothetical protein [Corallococcus]RKH66280.1 hypothetical protein D7X96_21780 [Corallococcus interemptor]RKI70945.1 hypothetical protein D7X55_09425 [Corallococcus sp. AB049A]